MPSRLAPAKINLGLRVLKKRSDGYHEIETVFLAINWCDTLVFEEAAEWQLSCSDASLPTDESNLALKAALQFGENVLPVRPHRIHLIKRIPHGAGLGGGSSDAAAVVRHLCTSVGISTSDARVQALAASLGADVPFFLHPVPSAAGGIGEKLVSLGDYRFPFYLAIVKPDISVGTADAYRWVVPDESDRESLASVVARNNPFRWWKVLVNDFESAVFPRNPEIAALKEGMYRNGAVYASMSGSGSAVFGLFNTQAEARLAARGLAESSSVAWFGSPYSLAI